MYFRSCVQSILGSRPGLLETEGWASCAVQYIWGNAAGEFRRNPSHYPYTELTWTCRTNKDKLSVVRALAAPEGDLLWSAAGQILYKESQRYLSAALITAVISRGMGTTDIVNMKHSRLVEKLRSFIPRLSTLSSVLTTVVIYLHLVTSVRLVMTELPWSSRKSTAWTWGGALFWDSVCPGWGFRLGKCRLRCRKSGHALNLRTAYIP